MAEQASYGMIKLTQSNYSIWKRKMQDLLIVKDLYLPVMGKEKPQKVSDEEWEILHLKASATIRQWVDVNIFHHISEEVKADELWKKLEGMYEKSTSRNKASIIRRLVNLKYRDGKSMTEHTSDFQGLVNQLASMKMTLEDELQALLLLSSLPDSWETLVVSLSTSAPGGKLTMEMVKESLMSEEARRKEKGETSSGVLVSEKPEGRGRSNSRHPHGHGNRDTSRGRSKNRKNIKCFHCNKMGHMKRECRLLKREQSGGSKEEKETNTVAAEGDISVIYDDDCINLVSQESDWVFDSGASFHVTPHGNSFSTYSSGDFGNVKMGNSGASKIVGIGDICLETNQGLKLLLKDVRHVPDIRLNLISTGRLDDDGFASWFGENKCKLTKGSLVVARGRKTNTLYVMQAKLHIGELNAIQKDASIELWHRRLGHVSEKGLQLLSKKNLLPNLQGASLKSCVDCLAGKTHRVAFHTHPPSRKSNILDLIHTDVCSMQDKTLGGGHYFVTFIDDHSRKVWATVLKTKDQVLDVFKDLHVKVERETGKQLKAVRADNGGEYRGPFEEYCRLHGIRLEKTPAKTPQLNGVAERMNRTIEERIRCMLSYAKLPKSFWGEAMRTAVDMINLSPAAALDGDVPNRVWTGKEVSYTHLRVFGCRAFVHIPKDERSKLDDKAKQCIFLGYGHEEFGYRLWDPVNRKVVRSRDVVFLEDQMTDLDEQGEASSSSVEIPVSVDPVPPPIQSSAQGGATQEDGDDTGNVEVPPVEDAEPVEEVEQSSPVPPVETQVRRSTRDRHPSSRYSVNDYIMLSDGGEPETYEEAMQHEKKHEWFGAMQEEMKSLCENHTYDLVKLPKGKKTLKNKWVYKLKTENNSSQPKYKARLVVKGFSQKKGIDFEEIFSPVVKMSSIRVVLGLAASLNLEVEQLDVKTAFLHGDLEEEIYMEQPEGFKVKGKENLVCRLKKSLYGLKQAPRQWYKKFDSFMMTQGYTRTSADHCVFMKKHSNDDFIILLLYVDDMLIVGRDVSKIEDLKRQLSKSFAMKDLGNAKQILGMKISRDRMNGKLWLSQENYIEKVLKRFNMISAKAVSSPLAGHFKLSSSQCPSSDKEKEEMSRVPYASAVGSLMYAMVCTRPDIAHAVGVVSRFLSNPGKEHWAAVKWILRYLRGTSRICLCFGRGEPMLDGYTDSDMAGDVDSRKSVSGFMMTFAGGAVSWQSKLQKCVALSTTEAEYIAITEGCKEALWIKKFLEELGMQQEKCTIYCDSQSAIHLSKNSTFHSKSKHIDVRYHWIRDVLEAKELYLEKIHTSENGSDMFTKALCKEKLEACRERAGLVEPPKWC